jgi:rhodanese-related sulfurtransferase
VADAERISVDELQRLFRAGERVVVLDVRTERTYRESDQRGRGVIRAAPERAVKRAGELGLSNHAWLVAYCA